MKIGRYDVVREIKTGGMARALLCRATDGKLVVCKVPVEDNPQLFARMRDEARVGTRVVHEHLVETLDLLDHEGRPVLVVGFIPGASMNELRAGGSLPAAAVARVGWQIASCLHALHEAKDEAGVPFHVIHRDVSSGNILVAERGDAMLIDLGIAHFEDGRSARTETGAIVGTARYLAPELLEQETYSPASDLWALGCVLAEAATGRPMFHGNTRDTIARIARYKGVLDLGIDDVDPGLARILGRILIRDPQARATAPELIELFRGREDALGGGKDKLAARVTKEAVSSTIDLETAVASTAISSVFTGAGETHVVRPRAAPEPPARPRRLVRGVVAAAIAIGVLSVVAGVALVIGQSTRLSSERAGGAADTAPPLPRPPRELRRPPRVAPDETSATLTGPSGETLPVPVHGPLIVNSWIGTDPDPDRPSFPAWRDAAASGALGDLPIMNVAWVAPEPAAAAEYHLDQHLFIDPGGRAFIRPNEVRGFSTLVFDKNGAVVARLHPGAKNFVADVRSAFLKAGGDPTLAMTPALKAAIAAMGMHEKLQRVDGCDDPCAKRALAGAAPDKLGAMQSAELDAWKSGVDLCLITCGVVR